ncbi:GDSL-type esterase/lipase family protein [Parasediminibacterium paludis]|uniref:GDSL-type esterase/lipase family protein n=1 Tax=Parasediminibacterium paludis TaxID=908966 RepID=A0ABV8PXM4_9BACT
MFWYEEDVKNLERIKESISYQPELVFYGSSSIRLWRSLNKDFENCHPINLGFGGSTLAACVWYFDRIMAGLQPKGMVLYAGDNDLGDGRHPEEVFVFFKQLMAFIRQKYGNIPVAYISIKPSIRRFNIIDQIRFTNKIISEEIERMNDATYFVNIYDRMLDANKYPRRDLFEPEGLHINDKGYALWKSVIDETLAAKSLHLLSTI